MVVGATPAREGDMSDVNLSVHAACDSKISSLKSNCLTIIR